MFDPHRPYNDLPDLRDIANDVETREVLKLCVEARTALAELKHAGRLLPNQDVLVNTLPLLEAQASSEIENIVTTRDALFRQATISNEDLADPATKEALRYRTALKTGFDELGKLPLATGTALKICRTIKNTELDIRKQTGTALGKEGSREVIYTPPEGESRIRDLLNDLFTFMHEREDIDPLIRMAIGHYQFEAIHPFTDGNGRTGRILNVLFLIEKDLIDLPTLYMSGYINSHKGDYYRLLQQTTRTRNWGDWLTYMITAVRESAAKSCEKINAIRSQMEATEQYIKKRLPKLPTKNLSEQMFNHPYSRIQNLVDAGIGERQSASKYLHALEKIGVLTSLKSGRDKLFINTAFLNLLLDDEHEIETFGEDMP